MKIIYVMGDQKLFKIEDFKLTEADFNVEVISVSKRDWLADDRQHFQDFTEYNIIVKVNGYTMSWYQTSGMLPFRTIDIKRDAVSKYINSNTFMRMLKLQKINKSI